MFFGNTFSFGTFSRLVYRLLGSFILPQDIVLCDTAGLPDPAAGVRCRYVCGGVTTGLDHFQFRLGMRLM